VARDREATHGAVPPPAPRLALGDRLRSARKARALSAAQVADALRLEESSVLALEEERFETLGAPVFVRGHLRRYAQLVGLSEEAVLEAYRSVAPDSDRLPTLARPREQAETLRFGAWAYWLAGALVMVGIVLSLATDDADEAEPPAAEAPILAPAPAPGGPAESDQ
jgi:cytoskeleton protein RodZ